MIKIEKAWNQTMINNSWWKKNSQFNKKVKKNKVKIINLYKKLYKVAQNKIYQRLVVAKKYKFLLKI